MHDIRWIRDNPDAFQERLRARGIAAAEVSSTVKKLIELDDGRKAAISKAQALQERRNAASKDIGAAKAQKDEAKAQKLMDEVSALKGELAAEETRQKDAEAALETELAQIPNLPLADVPVGTDEHGNVQKSISGTKPTSNATKQHFELGEALGGMDFETAAKLSGARFVVLKGEIARLERAIGQFMLDLHTTEHGYTEIAPPLMVRDEVMFGTAQLPKFADDQFKAMPTEHWLIPTAEVPLTNLVRESIVAEEELPLRFTALTPCFRAEAGAAGKDTRGMIRQHQFSKVELVSITAPEQTADEHERMLAAAEAVLKKLDLHYRVMTLCTGDMGFASQKTYDIEVWLPGQGAYREISSVSQCGDFQARRMQARCKAKDGKNTRFVHTLNGSGVAVGRALIAVMENYQNGDGSISVPSVLRPYMGNKEKIGVGK
ncbi:serine--tRNA ligase [Terrihabitans soli]|uniref:Serine--tRNA ligase n=1 Tax=Terrihabitans soli TaxID=708113 RepID=A0A6S6QUF3_9HYPH|nr:serine--tRNA ligase [Terrihabitans soli]BCJ90711.1 serine--tRNA ligase [Terrihabitans soli]